MDNKRFKMFLSITLIIIILAGVSFYIFKQLSNAENTAFEEYVPQQEISDEQLRQTYVKLYFLGSETGELQCENRGIDSKELISNPYLTLVKLLITGPNVEGLQKIIPEGTTVNSATLQGDTIILDLSSNFTTSVNDTQMASNMIYSIVNTLTELNEVTKVKFVIDGNTSANFANCDFSLAVPFARK